ncbi:MAG TPA: hypothetical protein PLY32_02900 [Salinivirgaceae bacterium]|nr:hypothetical protein [Salinivirgaceae bacterium]HQA76047.1 hypothetical protein [Salinivirgaceae bacterium]
MKIITPNLLKFAGTSFVLTAIFRFCLSYGLENKILLLSVTSAVLYGITMFSAGWFFGKRDWMYLPIYDVGFRFHLATYLTHNAVSELWFILGFNSRYEIIDPIHITAVIWGILLFIHFLFFLWTRKNTINHLDKDDLFE